MAPIVCFNNLKVSSVDDGSNEDKLVIDDCPQMEMGDGSQNLIQNNHHQEGTQIAFKTEDMDSVVHHTSSSSECVKSVDCCKDIGDDAGFFKRYRTVFTTKQLMRLERAFREAKFLTRTKKTELSKELNLQGSVLKVWFQNRRMREKRSKCENNSSSSKETSDASSSTQVLHLQQTPNPSTDIYKTQASRSEIIPYPTPYLHPFSSYQYNTYHTMYSQLCPTQDYSSHYPLPQYQESHYTACQTNYGYPYDFNSASRTYIKLQHLKPVGNSSTNARSLDCTPLCSFKHQENEIQQRQGSESFVYGLSVVPHSNLNFYHAKHFDYGQNKAILSHISVERPHVGTYSDGNCLISSYKKEQNPLKSLNNSSNISHYVQAFSYSVEPENQAPSHDVILGRCYQAETSDRRRSPSSGINSSAEGSVNLNCDKAVVSMNNYPSKVSPALSKSDEISQTKISKDQSSSQEKIPKQNDLFRPYI